MSRREEGEEGEGVELGEGEEGGEEGGGEGGTGERYSISGDGCWKWVGSNGSCSKSKLINKYSLKQDTCVKENCKF